MTRVLVVGESWVSAATHYKGWDQFSSVTFHSGLGLLRDALGPYGVELDHLPAHEAAEQFPFEPAGLAGYAVVLLSDVGANTLLLHPDTWLHGRRTPNRLTMLREWVEAGGGLGMAGGYYSFQGIDGRARYRGTAVEAVLPAVIDPWDDRVEVPEGFAPRPVAADHEILAGLGPDWPPLLGYNRFRLKDDAEELVAYGEDPILAVRTAGAGRTLAWASDIGPHWCPEEFAAWEGYGRLFAQAIGWLAGGSAGG
jgi:uncharacterized membrane protein